jgi:hypothetical protein
MHRTKSCPIAASLVFMAAMTGAWFGLPPSARAATYSFTDLSASQFMETLGYGVSSGQQFGYGYTSGQSGDHALLWSGTAGSVIDLNPSGFLYTYGCGISGGQEVGYGAPPAAGGIHALLWSGTPESVVDLNPSEFIRSYAYGTTGSRQVGFGYLTESTIHALLWSGSASSAVDLNPDGFTYSKALGTWGDQQIGCGSGAVSTGGKTHALLWSGSASSVLDLNPSGFTTSLAYQPVEVGHFPGFPLFRYHAAVGQSFRRDCHIKMPAEVIWYAMTASNRQKQVHCRKNSRPRAANCFGVPKPNSLRISCERL